MSKVVGKDLEFWWDGAEAPVLSASLSEVFDQLDSTDTATPGDGKDSEVGRAARSFKVDQNLYSPDGAEIASGSLVIGTRYRVTAAGATLTGAGYELGQLFEATSALVMDVDDKVKPLGAKIWGKDMGFTYNAIEIPATSMDISIKYDQLDGTDTSTAGDASETIVSRAERESKVSGIVRSETVDVLTTSPTPQTTTLLFASGQTVAGKVVPVSKEIADEVSGFAKIDYGFKWIGAPVETAVGLVPAVEKPFKIILKRGTSTNKQYSGNAIITEKTISSEIKGLVKISYTFQINGAVIYAVAN
jgi:hypothetical protein